jgi:putative transposase
MPAKAQGKEMISLLANEELRQFTYTLCKNKETALDIDILRYTDSRCKKDGTIERIHRGFVFFGVDWNLTKVKRFYRLRLAIESSYRMRNIVRPKTSTRNPVIRYFFAIVSFLLKNIWIVLYSRIFAKNKVLPLLL